jgi:OOP family OmpA-OmpF porin
MALKKELEKIITQLFDMNIRSIIIEGHTDSIGKDQYNQVLSEKRAKTVKGVLLDNLDLRDQQITAIGFGDSMQVHFVFALFVNPQKYIQEMILLVLYIR